MSAFPLKAGISPCPIWGDFRTFSLTFAKPDYRLIQQSMQLNLYMIVSIFLLQ